MFGSKIKKSFLKRTQYIWFPGHCKNYVATPNDPRCVHSGHSTRDCEFNSYVSYVLTLIYGYSILVAHTNHLVLLSLYLGWWWVGRWKAPFGHKSFEVHPINSQCVSLPMMGFEYVKGLPPIHKRPLRPSVGIMAHLVVSDLLIYPFSL